MSLPPEGPRTLEIPYRWWDVDGAVKVEIVVNDNPTPLGCRELARGFPQCEATFETSAKGYKRLFGWVTMLDVSYEGEGFATDLLKPLEPGSHPFGYVGYLPRFYDAPHADDEDVDFLAHTFLCGLEGEILDLHREARAILGFSWGYEKRSQRIRYSGPSLLTGESWNSHHAYLKQRYSNPKWEFAPGFVQHPLDR